MKSALALLLGAASVFSGDRRAAKDGAAAFKNRDYRASAEKFGEASRRNPSDPLWRLGAGSAKAAAGNADAAADLDAASKSSDPKVSSTAQYQLGTLALSAKNYAEAAERLRRALMIDPKLADAKRNLEIALANLKTPPPKQKQKPSPKKGEPDKKPKPNPEKRDDQFQQKAGMSKSQAEALLRSLDAEQRKTERVTPGESGRDW